MTRRHALIDMEKLDDAFYNLENKFYPNLYYNSSSSYSGVYNSELQNKGTDFVNAIKDEIEKSVKDALQKYTKELHQAIKDSMSDEIPCMLCYNKEKDKGYEP